MSRRFWKKLAGFIVINAAVAAGPEYFAGTATVGDNTALVLQDRKGHRAVIVESGSLVTRAVSDSVAAQLAKDYGLDRAALLIYGHGGAAARTGDAVAAVGRAIEGL